MTHTDTFRAPYTARDMFEAAMRDVVYHRHIANQMRRDLNRCLVVDEDDIIEAWKDAGRALDRARRHRRRGF